MFLAHTLTFAVIEYLKYLSTSTKTNLGNLLQKNPLWYESEPTKMAQSASSPEKTTKIFQILKQIGLVYILGPWGYA